MEPDKPRPAGEFAAMPRFRKVQKDAYGLHLTCSLLVVEITYLSLVGLMAWR